MKVASQELFSLPGAWLADQPSKQARLYPTVPLHCWLHKSLFCACPSAAWLVYIGKGKLQGLCQDASWRAFTWTLAKCKKNAAHLPSDNTN